MKKLDEIMELMADEMADFKNALLDLRTLKNELDEKSIPISTEALDNHLQSFLKKQEEIQEYQADVLKGIDQKLKKAIHIPKYILILFGSALLILICLNGYLIFSN